MQLAARGSLKIQDVKARQKIDICAPSHNSVGLYLRNHETYRQSKKRLLGSSSNSSTCSHYMVNFGSLAAEIGLVVWVTTADFNGFRVSVALVHGTVVVGVSQTAALNRGRQLYSAGRPSRWHWPTFLFYLSIFLFFPLLIAYHTSTHGVVIVRI